MLEATPAPVVFTDKTNSPKLEDDLCIMGTRIRKQTKVTKKTYITVSGGVDLVQHAWYKHQCRASIWSEAAYSSGGPSPLNPNHISWDQFCKLKVVDYLVVTTKKQQYGNSFKIDQWLDWVNPQKEPLQPKTILIVSNPKDNLFGQGHPNCNILK
eukprot:13074983-Ditylum_brightwellii.AAC.1